MSVLPIKSRSKFMRSRSRDVVVSDCGLSEIASKGKVFVASFVEYDHMFKESKCEKKPHNGNARMSKVISFRKATLLIMNK